MMATTWKDFEERLKAIQEVGSYSVEEMQHIREAILIQTSSPDEACHLALQGLNAMLAVGKQE